MGHGHTHNHNHNHGVDVSGYHKSFAIGIGLNISFIAVELFYGFLANSSALIADAGHNAGDVLGLVFAWIAIWLAGKSPKGRYSYGYKKSTILISVLNAIILFVAVGFILWDAIGKFVNPAPVGGTQVMIVAGIGVVINTLTALMFVKGQKNDLNIKGAFLHMAADAAVSLGVVIAGLLIRSTGANWLDPVMSILIALIIIGGTWRLFVDSVNLALDATPEGIQLDEVSQTLLAHEDVVEVHDLHIWAMSTSENAMSAHITVEAQSSPKLLGEIRGLLAEKFHLSHTTIQLETKEVQLQCQSC